MWRSATAVLLAASLLLVALPASVRAGSGTEGDPFRVYLVLWRGCEDGCQGFQQYFREQNIEAEIILRNADRDRTRLPAFAKEARDLHVDLVVTWGTTVTTALLGTYDDVDPARHIVDIPAVFMIVSEPVRSKIVPDLTSSGRNITGSRLGVPQDIQIKAIQAYRPFERLGMIYNENERNAVDSAAAVRDVANEMGFALVERTVPLDDDGMPRLDALPALISTMADEKVDFLYIGSSSFLVRYSQLYTKTAVQYGIPVASAGEVPVVTADALLGIVSRYYNVGQLAAFQAEQILVGRKKPQDMPIESLKRYSYIVNMDVARRLELYPPMRILRFAEIINAETN